MNATADQGIFSRVAMLETRVSAVESVESRIETKIDGLKNWLLGVVVSGFGALALAVLIFILQSLQHKG